MNFKGKLVIIGGAEDKGDAQEQRRDEENSRKDSILQRIVDESREKEKSRIEVVTSASRVPDEIGEDYIKAFGLLNATNVGVMKIENREEAGDKEILSRLKAADVVFFTGGNQLRLTSIIGGTPFFDILLKKLEQEHFIYAGTSAGAAAASESMIWQGSSADAIQKGEIKTSTGFGLVENVVFDTHFVTRGRIGRLFQIIVSNPKILGVGLEENSALLITSDGKMEAIGPGMTILVDGRHIRNTNLLEIREGVPLSIDNMTLHVMSKTDIYDLNDHTLTIITPDDCKP
ncbi:MAG TPA: cyanophycinase [Flavobacterium sp.]|jgi:cyanophycinase